MQGVGKAPGAVVFTAHQNHAVGAVGRAVVADVRASLAAAPPQQDAGHAHQRHAEGAEPQRQAQPPEAFAGVQLIDQFVEVVHRVMGLIGQQSAAGLIHVAVALGRAQGKHIVRVAGAREDQLAQVVQVGGL
ncbi:hypothetical protein D3C85_1605160 [compost metagenome]